MLGRVIIVRIRVALDNKLRKEQAGFRRGKGCMQQIFILRTLSTSASNGIAHSSSTMWIVFRESLWRIMKYYGIPSKIINLVKMSYKNFRCAVEHEGKLSKWFPVMSGVMQGCVMSGFLNCLYWL